MSRFGELLQNPIAVGLMQGKSVLELLQQVLRLSGVVADCRQAFNKLSLAADMLLTLGYVLLCQLKAVLQEFAIHA